MSNDRERAPGEMFRGPLGVFAAACLAIAVATEAAPVMRDLRWWLATAFHSQPYDLRLRLNHQFRGAVLAAHAVMAEFDRETPVVIHNKGGPDWFLALRLQPRRVYFDRGPVRGRLLAAKEPFVVVHLESKQESTAWWFEHFDNIETGRTASGTLSAVFIDGFENDLDVWTKIVTREDH